MSVITSTSSGELRSIKRADNGRVTFFLGMSCVLLEEAEAIELLVQLSQLIPSVMLTQHNPEGAA